MTKSMLIANVEIMLAGLAAESVVFGDEVSTGSGGGALSDLGRASATLGMMLTTWGVSGSLLHRGDRHELSANFAGDPHLRDAVEAELNSILNGVKAELSARMPALLGLAGILTTKLVLRGPEIEEVLSDQTTIKRDYRTRHSGEMGTVIPFLFSKARQPRAVSLPLSES